MAMSIQRTTNETAEKGDFKLVTGKTTALHVRYKGADHPTSMKLLEEANLRPLRYQEILSLLMKDGQLKNELKGKWFWLDGSGMDKDGIFTTNQKGELVKIKDKKLSIENKVRVFKGNQPLSFGVYSDYYAAFFGWRFLLDADDGPHVVAPVVVGVPKEKISARQQNAAGNVEAETLLREIEVGIADLQQKAARLAKLLRPT